MAGGMPNIDPSIFSLINSSASGPSGSPGGGGSIMPFIAGMGFNAFTDNIKKLSGIAGSDKSKGNISTGQTSQLAQKATTGSATGPNGAPAAPGVTGNPLLSLGKTLAPMIQGGIDSAAAASAAAPAIASIAPLEAAGTTAATAPSLLALLGLA